MNQTIQQKSKNATCKNSEKGKQNHEKNHTQDEYKVENKQKKNKDRRTYIPDYP